MRSRLIGGLVLTVATVWIAGSARGARRKRHTGPGRHAASPCANQGQVRCLFMSGTPIDQTCDRDYLIRIIFRVS